MLMVFDIVTNLYIFFVLLAVIEHFLKLSPKWYLVLIASVLFLITSFIPNYLSPVFILLLLFLIYVKETKDRKQLVVTILFGYLILMVIDIFFSLCFVALNSKFVTFEPFLYGTRIVEGIFFLILSHTKTIDRFWNEAFQKIDQIEWYWMIPVIVLFLFSVLRIYQWWLPISFLCFVGITFVLLRLYVEKNRVEMEYEHLNEMSKVYEQQLSRLRQERHEYINSLICIKSLASRNQDVQEFIDSLLNHKEENDYLLLKQCIDIPIDAIRGLIYQKMLVCKEREIPVLLYVSPEVKKQKKYQNCRYPVRSIAIILGIFLDNAIEASGKLSKKSIRIYLYAEENKLVFQISNLFEDEIHTQYLGRKGYSTKGKNRGYGLSYAKRVARRTSELQLHSQIVENIFVQYLEITME